jgi:hypothetical protein
MTLFILAYPEEEWRRLEKVVMSMPIDTDGDLVDGKPERLPKQIVSELSSAAPLGAFPSEAITDLAVSSQDTYYL